MSDENQKLCEECLIVFGVSGGGHGGVRGDLTRVLDNMSASSDMIPKAIVWWG